MRAVTTALSQSTAFTPYSFLTFFIFRKDHYANAVVPQVQTFKFEHFGHEIVVLHEHDIRKQNRPFVVLKNRKKRDRYYEWAERFD